jgi:hypothetical protein
VLIKKTTSLKRIDLDKGAADEKTAGLAEELVVFKLLADKDVGVGAELVTLENAPSSALNGASIQCDFPAVKPEHLVLMRESQIG